MGALQLAEKLASDNGMLINGGGPEEKEGEGTHHPPKICT